MPDIKDRSDPKEIVPDKALSMEQLLSYARDLAEVFQEERARREALEAANAKLEIEIAERKKAQEQLMESEERYRSLFEDSRDPIYITDGHGNFTDVNSSFLALFDCMKEDVVGMTGEIFLNAHKWREFQIELLEHGSVKNREMTLYKKGGASMECLLTATLHRAQDGQIVKAQGIIHDITSYKLSQEQMQNARKMDALSNLAGGVAHEIRNPLAISSSAAQLLMDDNVSEAFRKDCAKKIVSGIQRASVIIENLLTFARPVTDCGMTDVDIVWLLRELETSISDQAKSHRVQLHFVLHPSPLHVKGNASLLTQAILNLFMNSFAAMRENGGTLSVHVNKSGANAIVEVADTGHGIKDQHLEKVFDPFFSESSWGKGTGLGLSISYSIVKLHMGDIRVCSDLAKGTMFTIEIPLA
ncbi:two-component system sensor histidine kinase NtrB [Desulfomonile tiedjei]|uniref:histidine kinase n=1 Tax=Desulfomonile tiedjei (strain ATCC 49306 / DSM 6799 / DCB-1) TaxID=706587 RepID=I4CDA6_DESTA|nr:ATP-binding protein [Desulfomonile tiedjei]AFM27547.1 PAS domain S-box [Desulfomonile tiedjei DSM 6799]